MAGASASVMRSLTTAASPMRSADVCGLAAVASRMLHSVPFSEPSSADDTVFAAASNLETAGGPQLGMRDLGTWQQLTSGGPAAGVVGLPPPVAPPGSCAALAASLHSSAPIGGEINISSSRSSSSSRHSRGGIANRYDSTPDSAAGCSADSHPATPHPAAVAAAVPLAQRIPPPSNRALPGWPRPTGLPGSFLSAAAAAAAAVTLTRGSLRGLQAAAASSPPGSDTSLESLSLAALAAGLWDDGRGGREDLTPAAIVAALDRHIVGQEAAKRAVAVALRNRWRRMRVEPAAFRDEIMPKNILMVGPTGCGKTEVARRLAKLADAPFIKVEATKYTELGYVGRDVEEIIKDLVEAALVLVRQRAKERLAEHSAKRAEAIILRALVGQHASSDTLEMFREMYRRGEMDDTNVEIDSALLDGSGQGGGGGSGFGGKLDFGPGGVILLDKLFARPERPFGGPSPPGLGMGGGGGGPGARGGQGGKKTMKVSEARSRLEEAESEKLLSSDQVTREAIRAAEQDGIVFIDEIDKIVDSSSGRVVTGGGVSSEGVQRDLLPILEGSVVPTKHGNVSTEHVLFICSGAFHSAKPSDMLAELQGRLPIRVELKGLTAADFYRILTEPQNNMISQQQELLATEGVRLVFTEGAVRAVATLAEQANRLLDNIGARRLHTILERVLSDISFGAPERVAEARAAGQQSYEYVVDEQLVHRKLDDLLKKQDLSRYVL